MSRAKQAFTFLGIGGLLAVGLLYFSAAQALPNQVRVINNTDRVVYIHKGGYSSSVAIKPGKWKIFPYPFETTTPGTKKKVKSGILVATSGGRWKTTPNGYTYLDNPSLIICLNYEDKEHAHKTGNRKWTINRSYGHQEGCKIKGYHQPWYQPAN
ncbi:MAG: hypothetical protein K0U12_05015 [Gammaproteobacteria bacterium]|nr:hypothetical protein [Gammaproteobacteria bacterium]